VLTPNKNQIAYIKDRNPGLICHSCKLEHFEPARRYGTVINSQSLQYISLEDAFRRLDETILPGGQWIITDYFRTNDRVQNRGSHKLDDFREKVLDHG
jgi:hypothetical protein